MTDDLVKRLRKRAIDDRAIQANNEVVAAALRGQRLLFDQDVRSASNTYAVRLALDYERYAKNDAALAADWDSAADRIEALTAKLQAVKTEMRRLADGLPWSFIMAAYKDKDALEAAEADNARLRQALTGIKRAAAHRMQDDPKDLHSYYFHTADAALNTGKEPSHE